MESARVDNRNIFAFTAIVYEGLYPEYLSINRRDEEIYITVRSPSGGPTAEMRLPYDQLDELIRALRGARPANLYGSGDNAAWKHIQRRQPTDAPSHPVATDGLEKARLKIKRPRRPQS
jgi:hypothetical protein